MNDLELSLDDIIKKKLKRSGPFRGRNNVGTTKKQLKKIAESNNRINKPHKISSGFIKSSRASIPRGKGSQANVGDARLRIIQKQRQKMSDAREKLGQLSKQNDARLRLVKLRENQRGNLPSRRVPVFRSEHPILQRTIQSRINNSYFDEELMDYAEDLSYFSRNFGDTAIISEDIYSSYRNRLDGSVLYRTVENEMTFNRLNDQEKNIYTWTKPSHTTDELTNIPVGRPNSRVPHAIGGADFRGNPSSWESDNGPVVIIKKVKPQETVGILKRSSSGDMYAGPAVKIIKESPPPSKNKAPARTLSERFCQKGNVSSQKISFLKAKLEASQKKIKSNTPSNQSSVGHRIVVSNLVPSVTHEDVKELFEDIGELISSKVVRPGTAEVVYKLHKDAVKAVDVYHNRQLDGQPMKCLLVNNKSVLSASKSVKETSGKVGKPVVEVDMTAFRKALHKKSAS